MVRPIPPPEEQVFTVDEKIQSDIGHAKQQYLESVSLYSTAVQAKKKSLNDFSLYVTVHSVTGFTDSGPAGGVSRLHSVWKSGHQREEAASRHLCTTSHAAGLLQTAQEVWTHQYHHASVMFENHKKWITLMSPLTALRPGSCYETAMTRKFYHGRTETMRPCTKEAADWCAVMTDPASNVSVCMSETVHRGRITEEKGGGSSLWIFEH